MPNEPDPPPSVAVFYTSEFKRNIRQLAKKYKRIKADIQPLLDELEQGHTPGDQIPGVQYEVFKVRVRNSDSGKGKSGGYRIIYQRTSDGALVLITIYSKTDQEDIAPREIRRIIGDYEARQQTMNVSGTEATSPDTKIEDSLKAEPAGEMAADPDIRRELRQIEAEFAGSEADGLPDESRDN